MKNKTTATLLSFFLGTFGVHQFYLGKNIKGILYVLFCWTFIPTIISLIDFIILLVMKEERFNEKYNNKNELGFFGSKKKIKEGLILYFNEYPNTSQESKEFLQTVFPQIIKNGKIKGLSFSEIVNYQTQIFIEEQVSISGIEEKNEIEKYIIEGLKLNIEGIGEVIDETYLNNIISDHISDDALDPDEIENIRIKAEELNIEKYKSIENIKNEYKYYIKNWELDNGIIPDIEPDFILNKNEKCVYKKRKVEILEQKQVTKRINYSGPRARVKIAKGLSYNLGSYNVSTTKETKQVSRGIGVLNVTTKRILFKTDLKSTAIRLSAIVNLEPFDDGLIIHKSSGNPLLIKDKYGKELYQSVNGAIRLLNK